jgi:hypothetical protein
MSKKFFAILTILFIILGVSSGLVWAKNPSNPSGQGDIPEVDGTYDVPGHPELKVRVFVHNVKPDKPGKPTPPPSEEVCDLDDPDSEAVVDKTPWKLPPTFTYRLNPNSVPSSVGGTNLETIAASAFSQWTDAISGQVTMSKGADTTATRKAYDGQNIITWGRTSGSALGVTYIWYNPGTGLAVDLDTIMNQKFFWTWSNGNSTCAYTDSYDAQSILTHELGHWFGLDDHYTDSYKNNTMYGRGYKTDAKGDTLTQGDIIGIQAIYPTP